MSAEHTPHSGSLDALERLYVNVRAEYPFSVRDMEIVKEALRSLEEQLEAAQKRLAWAARLLRYPDGADQFSIDCRNWLNDYYAASSPASESTP